MAGVDVTTLDYGTQSQPPPLPWRRLPMAAAVGAVMGGAVGWFAFERVLWLLAGCQGLVYTEIGQPFTVTLHLTLVLAVSGAVVAASAALWGPSPWRMLSAALVCSSLFAAGTGVAIVSGRPFVGMGGRVPVDAVGITLVPAIGSVVVIACSCAVLAIVRQVAAHRPAT